MTRQRHSARYIQFQTWLCSGPLEWSHLCSYHKKNLVDHSKWRFSVNVKRPLLLSLNRHEVESSSTQNPLRRRAFQLKKEVQNQVMYELKFKNTHLIRIRLHINVFHKFSYSRLKLVVRQQLENCHKFLNCSSFTESCSILMESHSQYQ